MVETASNQEISMGISYFAMGISGRIYFRIQNACIPMTVKTFHSL